MSNRIIVNEETELKEMIARIVDERLAEVGLIKETGESEQPTANVWSFGETDTAGLPD